MKKLRNKKTGEIGYLIVSKGSEYYTVTNDNWENCGEYDSLADLNEYWEDYEEPKGIQNVELSGVVSSKVNIYYSTKEEAEKAVEKLKIFNKLKQKGFVFSGWYYSTEGQLVILADNNEFSETEPEDLTKLFGDKIC